MDLSALSDLELLTLTIIGEGRGEPIEGQLAVGNVIMNRCKAYKDTVDKVVLKPSQFSCWNDGDPNKPYLLEMAEKLLVGQNIDPQYKQIQWVAEGLIENRVADNTNGSLHYLTAKLFTSPNRPSWARTVIFAVTKGTQIFFNIPGEK